MIRQAIILAGGLGTRLRAAVPDLPKCMAPVAGKPFLYYLITYYQQQGIDRFILSLGYKHEMITDFLQRDMKNTNVEFVSCIEKEPLGTGGAVRLAAPLATTSDVLVVNGDTFFAMDMLSLANVYEEKKADCVLSLKAMSNMERYGVVEMNFGKKITAFREKKFYSSGLINGGVYALNVTRFMAEDLPPVFSFERDYLEALSPQRQFYGAIGQGYFIDIGIPEDYTRANMDFQQFSQLI